ncbi:hypothetical protein NV379_15035 [Paenibacillus sp. N1-5-1-14]|uniref:hypothetical protein n=1 Tax=Paenibacillus radicibacter TaxID=2972488 RepID=UPI00215968C7|nr:hypothetical protein [Paenibacillus radicibacter]MCR8643965.1 hypothetical protein [Paenibacillus radicibacter]
MISIQKMSILALGMTLILLQGCSVNTSSPDHQELVKRKDQEIANLHQEIEALKQVRKNYQSIVTHIVV